MKIVSAEFIKSAVHERDFPKEKCPEMAFVGRSNVGKSSLINTLVGRKGLAKTSSTPGRTRLVNFFRINHKLTFVDLPGYGYAKVAASLREEWGPMIEGYLEKRDNLKGVVLIMDIRRPPEKEEEMLIEFLSSLEIPVVFALTKVDKLSGNERTRQLKLFKTGLNGIAIPFSATTGEGKDEIWKAITELIKG
ncbi:MAG TPA: ribosome biogenesis GTP-binding protein YihA/YsxC [Thermodesulfobacteriota bacterium]|nr:ribosome biogenesis GTP-binding protein YihA/YsxC [Thermodesulfobacteriota bacterium]